MSSKVVKCMCEECSFNEEHQCHAGITNYVKTKVNLLR